MQSSDLIELEQWFRDYVAGFCPAAPQDRLAFDLKEEHTARVRQEIVAMAAALGLSEEQSLIAETAALLHDVGRFPQWERFRTFVDGVSVDHAACSVSVVKEARILERLAPDEGRRVLDAVAHHNARSIPKDLDPRARALTQLLRDADKLDIWRVVLEHRPGENALVDQILFGDLPSDRTYSAEILSELRSGRAADAGRARTRGDLTLVRLGWVFDLVHAPAHRACLERGTVELLCAGLPRDPQIRALCAQLLGHVKARAQGGPAG